MKNKKAEILSAVLELLKTRNFEDLTVNEICSTCSIVKSNFYYHFKSKDELLYTFFTPALIEIEKQIPFILMDGTPLEQIHKILELSFSYISAYPVNLLRNIVRVGLTNQDNGLFKPKSYGNSITEILIKLIDKAQQSGEINNNIHPELLYENIVLIVNGFNIKYCSQNGDMDYNKCLIEAINILFGIS